MKVLVAGGSGYVGTAFVGELIARDHDVTVLARTPGDADLPAGVARVALDLTAASREELADALAGHDAVVNLVALSPLSVPPGGEEMHETVHFGGTEALVAAAEAGDVLRFVQMSALGADPDGVTHYIRAKGAAERVVRDSDLEWTVVRPSVVFGDGGEFVEFTRTLTTPYVTGLPGAGSTTFQPIWVGDLAGMLADCVEDGRHAGQTYELGGPEVFTLAEVARLVYAAEGKSLRVVPLPMLLARAGLTLGGLVPGFPMGPDQYRSLSFENTVGAGDPSANDVTAFGADHDDLRTFRAYLFGDGDDEGDDEGDEGDEGNDEPATDGSLLTGRGTLALFAFLTLSWLVPEVAATTFGVDLYAYGLIILYIPSYLVMMVTYDGLLGLEHVTYAIQDAVPGEWALAWDAGLLVTFYLFSVVAGAGGRAVRRRFEPGRRRNGSRTVEDR